MVLRIFKTIATGGFLAAALECTKFEPGPTGEAYSAPPDPLAGLKGPTSKREGGEGERKRRKEGKRKGTGGTRPLSQICVSASAYHLISSYLSTLYNHQILQKE